MAWYISLTLRWTDQENGIGIQPFIDYCNTVQIPNDRIRIPPNSMHSTLFVFSKFDEPSTVGKSMRDTARDALDILRNENKLLDLLKHLPSFNFKPIQLKHFSFDSTIQFEIEKPSSLETLRATIQKSLKQLSCRGKAPIQFFDDENKNSGSRMWGSIARCPFKTGPNMLQQEISITQEYGWITATDAILSISDDSLGNLLMPDDYIPIVLGQND